METKYIVSSFKEYLEVKFALKTLTPDICRGGALFMFHSPMTFESLHYL